MMLGSEAKFHSSPKANVIFVSFQTSLKDDKSVYQMLLYCSSLLDLVIIRHKQLSLELSQI